MSLQSVRDFFSMRHLDIPIIELEVSTATVALAAEAHGVPSARETRVGGYDGALTIATEAGMAIRVVRLGEPRVAGEGIRLGTVRRPPRGVPKSEFAARNWYDVWYPNLAPSVETMKLGQQAATPGQWERFARKYRAEMATAENARTLDVLAALSHQADFSVGCYCADEARCHRSILRALLAERGASLHPAAAGAGG